MKILKARIYTPILRAVSAASTLRYKTQQSILKYTYALLPDARVMVLYAHDMGLSVSEKMSEVFRQILSIGLETTDAHVKSVSAVRTEIAFPVSASASAAYRLQAAIQYVMGSLFAARVVAAGFIPLQTDGLCHPLMKLSAPVAFYDTAKAVVTTDAMLNIGLSEACDAKVYIAESAAGMSFETSILLGITVNDYVDEGYVEPGYVGETTWQPI